MPDISLPEIHLPDFRLREGLRDMSRTDIQRAIGDRVPKRSTLPDIGLANVQLPKAVEERLVKVERAINRMDLPKVVEDRLPRRRRSNPILPLAALLAVGSMFIAAWWLITSPGAETRVRSTVDGLRSRLAGPEPASQLMDDEADLGSLVGTADEGRPSVAGETWPETTADLGVTVSAGNGAAARS